MRVRSVGTSGDVACPRYQGFQIIHQRASEARTALSVACVILGRVPPPTTFHLVRRDEWEATDGSLAYLPADFAREGFVHCTDGADEVAATANRYFAEVEGDLLALVLDRSRIGAPIRYEDAREVYPHVYGPIQRAAIIQVLEMRRDATGAFLPPNQ
jgi:uncharacterized protein (DUF952 family)